MTMCFHSVCVYEVVPIFLLNTLDVRNGIKPKCTMWLVDKILRGKRYHYYGMKICLFLRCRSGLPMRKKGKRKRPPSWQKMQGAMKTYSIARRSDRIHAAPATVKDPHTSQEP